MTPGCRFNTKMVKAYLRYERAGAFGVVSSGPAPCYDASGRLLVTAALENLAVWNVKQGSLVSVGCLRVCACMSLHSAFTRVHTQPTPMREQVATLVPGPNFSGGTSTSSSHTAGPEVTCITRAPGASAQIAAGYSDGSVSVCACKQCRV